MLQWNNQAVLDPNNAIDWGHPLNRGRVGLWVLLQQTLTNDCLDLCFGQHAIRSGTRTRGTRTRAMPFVVADFNNTSTPTTDYYAATLDQAIVTGTTGYSWAGWVYATSTTGAKYYFALHNNSTRAQVMQSASATSTIAWRDSGTATQIAGGSIIDSKWHHVAGSYDGTNTTLYVDGVAVSGPSARTWTTQTFQYVAIGKNAYSNTSMGAFSTDTFTLWNRPLSSSDIAAEYNAARLGYLVPNSPIRWGQRRVSYPKTTLTNYTLTAAAGSHSLTGQSATLKANRVVVGNSGAFTLAGQHAALKAARRVVADVGAYTIAGQNTDLLRGYSLVVGAGAFSLAGQDASLRIARLLTANVGTYAVSGQSAGLSRGYSTSASLGSFSLNGQSAGFRVTRILGASAGEYLLTGQSATLRRGLSVMANVGGLSFTGQNADLLAARRLTAAVGEYILTGQAVTLNRGRTLTAEAASYLLAGQDVSLKLARRIAGEAGTFTLAGQAANLRAARLLSASAGSFVLSGQDATLRLGRSLHAGIGVYVLTGQDVILVQTIDPGAMTIFDVPATRLFAVPSGRRVFDVSAGNRAFPLLASPVFTLSAGERLLDVPRRGEPC